MTHCLKNWEKFPWWGHRTPFTIQSQALSSASSIYAVILNFLPQTNVFHNCGLLHMPFPFLECTFLLLWLEQSVVFYDPTHISPSLWGHPLFLPGRTICSARSPTVLVYISIITLTTQYCNFPFQVSVTPLYFKIQKVKNLHLLIFYIPRVQPMICS